MIYTTLNKIREQYPCSDGWKKLLTNLEKTEADDEALSLLTILESNGLYDALWCLSACDGIEKEARLYAVACARRVQHLMNDQRSIDALDVAERYAYGNATNQELEDARTAWAAVCDAASYAASYAAWDAARDAARGAASAAWSAVRGDANAAAWAARSAAWAACGTANDTWSTVGAAARDAEIKWQKTEFRRVFCS
jgi:hypothetical protein